VHHSGSGWLARPSPWGTFTSYSLPASWRTPSGVWSAQERCPAFSAWKVAFMTGIEHLLGLVDPLVRQYGIIAVPVIITLESLGAPLPGESLLIFGSVMAEHGNMSFPLLRIGGVVGDNIGYLIGKRFGRVVVLRYGDKIGFIPKRLSQSRRSLRGTAHSPLHSRVSLTFFANSTAWWRAPLRWNGGDFCCLMQSGARSGCSHGGLPGILSASTSPARGFGLLGAVILAVLVIGAIIYAMRRERTGDPWGAKSPPLSRCEKIRRHSPQGQTCSLNRDRLPTMQLKR
jgi:hypothetical protein